MAASKRKCKKVFNDIDKILDIVLDEDKESNQFIDLADSDYDCGSEDLFSYELENISQGNSTQLQPLRAPPSPPQELTCTSSSTPQRLSEDRTWLDNLAELVVMYDNTLSYKNDAAVVNNHFADDDGNNNCNDNDTDHLTTETETESETTI